VTRQSHRWRGLEHDLLDAGSRPPDRQDRLIPMINVVFLLLIFFLIAGTIRTADDRNIEPPELAASSTLERNQPVLSIEADGSLYFQDQAVEAEAAITMIRDALAEEPDQERELQIRADRRTPASIVLPFLQKLRDSGFQSISLIAVKKAE